MNLSTEGTLTFTSNLKGSTLTSTSEFVETTPELFSAEKVDEIIKSVLNPLPGVILDHLDLDKIMIHGVPFKIRFGDQVIFRGIKVVREVDGSYTCTMV